MKAFNRLTQLGFHLQKTPIRKMSTQYKNHVGWFHETTQSAEATQKVIELAKDIVKFQAKQDGCAFDVVLAPRDEGQETRLEMILNVENEEYMDQVHRNSEPYKQLKKAMDADSLVAKEPSRMTFKPQAGFLHRDDIPSADISDQFVWIAKLDTHPGKRSELLEIIYAHAKNVERTEDGALTFLVLESKDDENSVTLLERYVDEKYFKEVHAVSDSMKNYRAKTGPLLKERNSAGFRIAAGFFDKREVLA